MILSSYQNIVSRPLGVLRFAVFIFTFTVSRIPIWFLILSAVFVNNNIELPVYITLIISVVIFRSYLESEIAGGGLFYFFTMRILRFISALIFTAIILALYFYLLLNTSHSIEMRLAVVISVFLFWFLILRNKNKGWWRGYQTPISYKIILNILWFYILAVPDSIQMKISAVTIIYVIEFYNLIYNRPLNLSDKKIK